MKGASFHGNITPNSLTHQFDVIKGSEMNPQAICRAFIHPGYSSVLELPGLTPACAVRPAAPRGRSLALRPRPVGRASTSSQTRIKTPSRERKNRTGAELWGDSDSFVLWGASTAEQGVQKVSVHMWETQRGVEEEEGMRQEQQVTFSLVFRQDRGGVMHMTLVRGDIYSKRTDADGSVKHDWFGGHSWMMTEWNYSKLHAL